MSLTDKNYREEITNKIIEALKRGAAPWQQTWSDNVLINAVTGNYYQGINSIILSVEGDRLSQDGDTRWATKKQAESKGWAIEDGAEPTEIFVLILPKKNKIDSGLLDREIIVGNKKSAFRKTFEVYHASQIRGISLFVKTKRKPVMSNEVLDRIVFYSSARIFEGGNEAYYSPRDDLIRMPYRHLFIDTESYYSTLLHELAHWT